MPLLKHFLIFFFAAMFCVNATFAGDIEDADAALLQGDYAKALKKYKSAAAKNNAIA